MRTLKEKLTELLIKHEGCELEVYQDTKGLDTIGVGRCLETRGLTRTECEYLKISPDNFIQELKQRGITQSEAEYLLSNDIDYFIKQITKRLDFFPALPETAKIVLLDMAFNMGIDGLLKFVHTLENIEHGRYIAASQEMLNSKWKNQVGQRAYDLANMLSECQA